LKFQIISKISFIEMIAAGSTLRDRRRLARRYGRGNWRKMKGQATVRLADGTICEAEIHWYEAHGIGKKELKFKKPLDIGKTGRA
jgi:acyl dehydratase